MVESSFLIVNKKKFICHCGCNLFHKGDKKGLWICNCCGEQYGDESYIKETTIFETITKDIPSLAFTLSELIKMDNPPFYNYEDAVSWLLKKVD